MDQCFMKDSHEYDIGLFNSLWNHFVCNRQEYRVYTYFYQKWKDPRLAGKLNRTLTIKGADIQNIWLPDPYCYNARESNMMMPDSEMHSSVSIKPSGDIFYSKGYVLGFDANIQTVL